MEQIRFYLPRFSLQKEYAVHGKFLITSIDEQWRLKMHHCTIIHPETGSFTYSQKRNDFLITQ